MSQNPLLKTAVDAKIRINGWAETAVIRIRKRYEHQDRGQTAFEYLGIILVVVVIIGAMIGTGIGQSIVDKIKEQVGLIKAG
ncbi:hypothetical protein ACFZBM_07390 [Streptomyces lavendulae]|uniref:Uncharacterized protein n=1 Tax=Streptomyces lavendulae subsp. lavendulae TaxID=58340 RepID=A0A2K8PE54_STRLA|nr:hypothetical protein [Streptomyces lavendulae]ATZ24758.1 hypothetical protein SLAV_14520 [Streptomyces lavendulae subsp. lavendulae]QUQ54590.1 hypothetical protein SLLC_12590 [Streptomyces lavendulae subsp. lavendulae]GLV80666.1 hypothetical protein Slala03_03550 [Streptomyces lavendulae subsp. lavendulae]